MSDPTAWLRRDAPRADRFRVAVAHGGVREFLAGKVDPDAMVNDIPIGITADASLDYLALGDWHGHGRVNERAWYSGTPEATSFTENQPGHVLVVSIDRPREIPRVEPVRVARYAWQRIERLLATADDVQILENELSSLPSPSGTLLEVVLRGELDLGRFEQVVTGFEARYRGVFRHLRWNTDELHVRLSSDDFESLPRQGWMGRVVDRLREGRASGATPDDCQRALQQLHRISLEERYGGGSR